MRSSSKKIIIILLIIILGVLSIARIMYVNSKQRIDGTHTYKIGEMFEYNGFQVKAEKVDFYSADDLKQLYQEIPEEVLPEKEMVIKLEVKNTTDVEQTFSLAALTMQIGIEKGSAIDPYVYPYLNPKLKGDPVLEKKETQIIMLAFPIQKAALEAKEELKLILSLYPKKYEIEI